MTQSLFSRCVWCVLRVLCGVGLWFRLAFAGLAGRSARTNLLEWLFVEERRRLKIIPNARGEKPVLKLMFAAMKRAAERWKAIRITEFERRQMAAVRAELDKEYEAQIGLGRPTSKEKHSEKISSTSRT
ncbi:hypothetical protein [Nitratireductor sp. XY-223]|uniref:hypothetical protein n=1 Tax=Nitratireductor sp. XY-223 TaxID=2561926 RepID=UPI0010AABA56|nr:hypothetical protein [Nitratireductor sp. XY-223]